MNTPSPTQPQPPFNSRHFTLAELTASQTAKRHGIANVPDDEAVRNLETLCRLLLDPLRDAWGSPLYVNSGYRCRALNRLVGGARGSAHCSGRAADIRCASRQDMLRLLGTLMSRGDIWQHVDQCIAERCDSTGLPAWLHLQWSTYPRRMFLRT